MAHRVFAGEMSPRQPPGGAVVMLEILLRRILDRRYAETGNPDEKCCAMIVYDLQCSKGHRFEGWFDNLEAFETQKEEGLLSCPLCEDTDVLRVPSTFAIKASGSSACNAANCDAEAEMTTYRIARKLQDFLEKNFDDVGCEFAKEALKIHYGVTEPRNIKGVSTREEEEVLKNEGIEFFKVPAPPNPDRNS